MSTEKYHAIKYIRLSDADDNMGESDSVVNQRKLIDEYLKKHPEIEVVSEKVDDGWSGILFDRPAFNEMIQDIEAGKANCIITKDLSRFGREFTGTGRYLRRIFPAYNVRFIAIIDDVDTLINQGDDLIISIKTLINDEYCRDISKKTRSALNVKRSYGDYVGACPVYGYRKAGDNHNQLVIDEYPACVVRDIFRMKLEGMSALKIAEALNARGILSPIEYKRDRGLPHPTGGFADAADAKWSVTSVIRILKNEVYAGTLIQGKSATPNYKLREVIRKPEDEWLRTETAHEAIVRPQDFELVQRIMRLDTRTTPNGEKVHIFSGALVCGCCGNRMTRKTVPYKGKSYYYYYCPTGKKNGCNSSGMMKESDLISCVLESVRSHIANVASLEALIAGLDAESVGRRLANELEQRLLENEGRLDKIRGFKAGLYERMMDGLLSKDEHKSLKDKYSEDASLLIAANNKLRQEIDDTLSCKHERMVWTEHFRRFENLSEIDRRTVANLIRTIRIISKTEIDIEFNYKLEYEKALSLSRREVA